MPDELQPWQKLPPADQRHHALKMIRQSLSELQAGELFCLDRGFPWTIEAEGYRREWIAAWFDHLPYLRDELPTMWALLESNQTIGDKSGLLEEVDAAHGKRM